MTAPNAASVRRGVPGPAMVSLAELHLQRDLGWPDFHPEDYCHQCGRRNPSWSADSPLWNRATEHMPRDRAEILCPACFVLALEAETGLLVSWQLSVDDNSREADALREACA